jgi:hypothetical protein
MKTLSLAIVLVAAVFHQSNLGGCFYYWPPNIPDRLLLSPATFSFSGRVNNFFKSILLRMDNLKKDSQRQLITASSSVMVDHREDRLQQQQQRQLSYSKNVYINKTTSHTTVTVSLISTTTVSTSQFCAKFIGNVGGGCRRSSRQLLLDSRNIIHQPHQHSMIDDDENKVMSDEMTRIQPNQVLNRYCVH